MNRRLFLQSLLSTGAVAAVPKRFIFDMGANLWKVNPALMRLNLAEGNSWTGVAVYDVEDIQKSVQFLEVFNAMFEPVMREARIFDIPGLR